MKLIKPDYIPMLHDAGLDVTILSLFAHSINVSELRLLVNNETDFGVENADLQQYISDVGGLGLIVLDGELPSATERPDAPTGLGQSEESIWFTKPDDDEYLLRWYVDGGLVVERVQDCEANRGATKAELGVEVGNVVQICVVVGGVVGWWARIEVT